MARSNIPSSIVVYSFLFFLFGSTLSLPTDTGLTLSTGNNATDTSFNLGPLPSGGGGEETWVWVSGDGTQMIPINGPQDTPKNITASSSGPLTTSNSNNGGAYQFAFGNVHGPTTKRPLLANFLFSCALGLFDKIPSSGQGARTPYPTGKYVCRGNPSSQGEASSPGMVRIQLVRNPFGWQMDFHDVAVLLNIVHDLQGSRDEVQFFDFEVKYTNAVGGQEFRTVAYGEWEATGANAAAAVTS